MPNLDSGGAGVRLTAALLLSIFPDAPDTVIDAFVEKQGVLLSVGVNKTRQRLGYFFANVHHETAGFTIKLLTENINYSAARMAQVWPNRFKSAAAVQAKYGTAAGWQKKAFDDIYGNRMGNRPGTSDGSLYIGRGGPQVTGRDGYAEIGKRVGVDLVSAPDLACNHSIQPEICAAFWDWKGLNKYADAGNFIGCVKLWNGGTNGLPDRQVQLARITKILQGAEWGALAEVGIPTSKPATQKPPDIKDMPPDKQQSPAASQPPTWGGFFMSFISIFKRK
jgi:putative chitinase